MNNEHAFCGTSQLQAADCSSAELSLNDYQDMALSTAIYPKEEGIVYCTLGLAGETGEVVEKVKKWKRDDKLVLQDVALELSDVLWYAAVLADELGFTLEQVAQMNINKLQSRKERGVLGGNGDHR